MRQYTSSCLTYSDARRDPRLNGIARGLSEILAPLLAEVPPQHLTRLASQVDGNLMQSVEHAER